MENSIEEDIKILESIIEEYEDCSVPEIDMQVDVTFREKQNNALNTILSDYKRVLKENEELDNDNVEWRAKYVIQLAKIDDLQKENKGLKEYITIAPNLDEMTATKYSNIQRYAYIQGRAEEQQKAKQIIYENFISKQEVKDQIEKEIKYHEKNILDIENITMLKGKTAKEEAEIEFNKYAIVVLKKMSQELLEGRKQNV